MNRSIIFYISFIAALIALIVAITQFFISSPAEYSTSFWISLVLASFTVLMVVMFLYVIFSNKLPIAHNVAIVGFPESGKTTLITILFGEIFARRVLGVQATPKGARTIER